MLIVSISYLKWGFQGSVHTGPALTPAEVLIAIHGIDPERDHIPLPMVVLSTITAFKMFFSSPEKPIVKAVAFTRWLPVQSILFIGAIPQFSSVSYLAVSLKTTPHYSFKHEGLQNFWTLFLTSIPINKLLVNFHLQSVPLCHKNSILQQTLTLSFMTFNDYSRYFDDVS